MCATHSRKAFTLVELLVVVGIVGILLGVLIPSLGAARQQSRQLACAGNLRAIGQLVQVYAAQNDDRIPHGPLQPDTATTQLWAGGTFIVDGLLWQPQHVGLGLLNQQHGPSSNEMFFCPTDPVYLLENQGPAIGAPGKKAFGSYLYRQLEAVSELGRSTGRIDQLGHVSFTGLNAVPAGGGSGGGHHTPSSGGALYRIEVQALAVDRNYLQAGRQTAPLASFAPQWDPAVNHGNARANVLYLDGAVLTFDNESQPIPEMLSPPLLAGQPVQAERQLQIPWATVPAGFFGHPTGMRHHMQRVLVAADFGRSAEPWRAPIPSPPQPGPAPF